MRDPRIILTFTIMFLFFWVYLFHLHMGDILHGRCKSENFFLYCKPGNWLMCNFSPAISKATRWIRRKTSWKLIMNLEKYGTNCKGNVEKSFWTLCECCRRNLRGNQIKRISAEVFKNNSELAFFFLLLSSFFSLCEKKVF